MTTTKWELGVSLSRIYMSSQKQRLSTVQAMFDTMMELAMYICTT